MLAVDSGSQYVSVYNSLNQTLSPLMVFRNCALEMDKFLDLSKLVYDDHKHKRARCELAAGDKKTFWSLTPTSTAKRSRTTLTPPTLPPDPRVK
jgi:hypothetical protein